MFTSAQQAALALALCALAACRAPQTSINEPSSTPVPTGSDAAPIAAGADASGGTPQSVPVAPPMAPVCRATGAADVNITVAAASGPTGGAPRPITNKLYSMNVDDQVPEDYVPALNPNYVSYLRALRPALLRWPTGYYSQTYQFSATGSGAGVLTPALIDGFMGLCKAVGAAPLMAVNTLTGTAQNAASFVQFVNKQRSYDVTWWQIGNEPDIDGYDPSRGFSPAAYAKTFLSFQAAMRAVDPRVKLVGGEVYTGEHVLGEEGQMDWMTPILQGTQSSPMDAIAWHWYPMDSSQSSATSSATPTVAHVLQEDAPDWPPAGLNFPSKIFPRLRTMQASYAPRAELWVDEMAEDSGKANGGGISDRVVGALWAADALGRMAEQGADATFHFLFKGTAEHKYSLIDEHDVPRPEYYSYWLYAQAFGDRVVAAKSDAIAQVAAHAATLAADGTLRVVLVNKTAQQKSARLALSDYAPRQAHRYQLVGTSALDTTIALNGRQLTPALAAAGVAGIAPEATADACTSTILTLPPLSVTVLIFSAK